MATQKVDEAHEAPTSGWSRVSTAVAALHVPPELIRARPRASTPTQNEAVGHDTAVRPSPPSAWGVPQALPLYVAESASWSTTAQKLAETHVTDPAVTRPETGELLACHEVPLNVTA